MSVSPDLFSPTHKINFSRRYTYDELTEVIGETNQPHELWRGQLVVREAPFWDHQEIVLRFYVRLLTHIQREKLGKVIVSPIDMILAPDSFVQPDVAFLLTENLYRIRSRIHGPADLVAEVISPDGRYKDLIKKRDLYEGYGVKEYWVIDPDIRTVVIYGMSPERRYEIVGRCPEGKTARSRLLEGFEIDVTSLLDG